MSYCPVEDIPKVWEEVQKTRPEYDEEDSDDEESMEGVAANNGFRSFAIYFERTWVGQVQARTR